MGILDKGKDKEEERKRKKRKEKKKKRNDFSTLEKKPIETSRESTLKTTNEETKTSTEPLNKIPERPNALHPAIVAGLNSTQDVTIKYNVTKEDIGYFGITRELFPIFDDFDEYFEDKAFEIAGFNNRLVVVNDEENVRNAKPVKLGETLNIPVTKDELDVLKLWNENHNIRFFNVNRPKSIGEIVTEVYHYYKRQYKNPEDQATLSSYFPLLISDSEYDQKYQQIKELNKDKVEIQDGREVFDLKGIAIEKTDQDRSKTKAITEFEAQIDGSERSNKGLPAAPLQQKFMKEVMSQHGISYASVYAKETSKEEFKKNPFKGKEVGQVISHGSGKNEKFKEYEGQKEKNKHESYFLTQEGFKEGSTSTSEDEKFTVSDMQKLDLSGMFLMDLSACESGLASNWTPAEKEHMSLVEAALKAGADNALGNYWKVEDSVQPYFTYVFFAELFKDPERNIASALRKTQLLMMSMFKNPKQWASFYIKSADFIKEDYEVGNKYRNELARVKVDQSKFEEKDFTDFLDKEKDNDPVLQIKLKNLNEANSTEGISAAQYEILLYLEMQKENAGKHSFEERKAALEEHEGIVEIKRIEGEMGV
ncbi:MAG: CHAT domain-containing protein, partial [Cytophagaceae bacterium]|nr:CHAT domain-containing protein [Cytophagaceae bacterium]